MIDDVPRYVSALGMSDEPGGWRDHKLDGGVLLDIASGEVVTGGMCMPHSPRWYGGRLWILESGRGILSTIDPETGDRTDVAAVPGFARGLSFVGPYAFIGLSQVREHVFDGLPLTGEGVERNCGVWVIDVRIGSGRGVAQVRGRRSKRSTRSRPCPALGIPEIVEPGGSNSPTPRSSFPTRRLHDVPEDAPAPDARARARHRRDRPDRDPPRAGAGRSRRRRDDPPPRDPRARRDAGRRSSTSTPIRTTTTACATRSPAARST